MRGRWRVSLASGWLGACLLGGNPFAADPAEEARRVADRYAIDLRWERYREAAASVHPDSRSAFQQIAPLSEGRLRVTSYEVDTIRVLPDRSTAEAMVRYDLIRIPSVVEEQRREILRMRREDGRWYVDPDLGALARDLGLTAQP
jgi:hypothetical protein